MVWWHLGIHMEHKWKEAKTMQEHLLECDTWRVFVGTDTLLCNLWNRIFIYKTSRMVIHFWMNGHSFLDEWPFILKSLPCTIRYLFRSPGVNLDKALSKFNSSCMSVHVVHGKTKRKSNWVDSILLDKLSIFPIFAKPKHSTIILR